MYVYYLYMWREIYLLAIYSINLISNNTVRMIIYIH